MANFIYELNSYVKNDVALLAAAGLSSIEIRPMVGYEDDVSPTILYWWYPGIKSAELYFFHEDHVKYTIIDENFDRALNIGNRILQMLNNADNIQNAATGFTHFIPKYSILARAETSAPTQREGFYYFSIMVQVGYVPIA